MLTIQPYILFLFHLKIQSMVEDISQLHIPMLNNFTQILLIKLIKLPMFGHAGTGNINNS